MLGSVQLISDRCLEMQRSKHGSHSALELQTEPLGLSCSLRWCWERGQEWSGPGVQEIRADSQLAEMEAEPSLGSP